MSAAGKLLFAPSSLHAWRPSNPRRSVLIGAPMAILCHLVGHRSCYLGTTRKGAGVAPTSGVHCVSLVRNC
jgi:hypothetical protein